VGLELCLEVYPSAYSLAQFSFFLLFLQEEEAARQAQLARARRREMSPIRLSPPSPPLPPLLRILSPALSLSLLLPLALPLPLLSLFSLSYSCSCSSSWSPSSPLSFALNLTLALAPPSLFRRRSDAYHPMPITQPLNACKQCFAPPSLAPPLLSPHSPLTCSFIFHFSRLSLALAVFFDVYFCRASLALALCFFVCTHIFMLAPAPHAYTHRPSHTHTPFQHLLPLSVCKLTCACAHSHIHTLSPALTD
jgi:hypothetical protein